MDDQFYDNVKFYNFSLYTDYRRIILSATAAELFLCNVYKRML